MSLTLVVLVVGVSWIWKEDRQPDGILKWFSFVLILFIHCFITLVYHPNLSSCYPNDF
ncbi:hypothetical protein LINGRAHAP2_LOCUS24906 [Linum grandiflorum]